ncbi:Trm112 family protein [Dietzia sp. UBA5065]|uniref:Trm112 family protein n=1 Tax=Dietzia sp. UBA5065 TaxID=1946422 RepID=UPI0025B86D39|nr:Trm112 family protein [Dietzia sp. UBA5065]HMT48879.1 Trm112 family protein [Dietzia sp.]
MSAIDDRLLEILACPEDKGPLLLAGQDTLYNPRLRRAYRIDDGIPVLLVDESRQVDESEHAELVARAGGIPQE